MVRDRAELLIFGFGTIGIVLIAAVLAYSQPPQGGPGGSNRGNGEPPPGENEGPPGGLHGGGGPRPVYQRRGFGWMQHGDGWRRNGHFWSSPPPSVSAGWFQRPYPYHLDYYKMRWGGSYAPYFGNLYGTPFGTPQVVNGPYGDGGPGGNGLEFGPGYPPAVEGMMDNGYVYPPGVVEEQLNSTIVRGGAPPAEQPPKSEALPTPKE